MFRSLLKVSGLMLALCGLSGVAHADKVLTYTIDPGTVGVITSGTEGARLVIQVTGDCKAVPYSIVAGGVLAAQGTFNLTNKASMPLDYTNVTLSCSAKGVDATVEQGDSKSGPLGF